MLKFIGIFFLFIVSTAWSQSLIFTHQGSGKTYVVTPGTKLYLGYKGYGGQQEFAANYVYDITDSTITLGSFGAQFNLSDKPDASTNNFKTIRIADLTHFRKRSLGGELTRDLLKLSSTIGSILWLGELYRSKNVSTGNAFLISFGTGLVLNWSIRLAYPDNAKNRLSSGWTVTYKP
jgi:hypothetical protein